MKISNARNEVITTVAGIIFWAITGFLLIVDVYKESYEVDWKILVALGVGGLFLILAPDDLYGIIKKKADEINLQK